MTIRRLLTLGCVMALSPAACKDDATGDGGGSTTSDGSSSTGDPASSSSTTADDTTGTTAVESTGPSEVMISGEIRDLVANAGIANAQLSLYEVPGVTAQSAEDGSYELGPVAPNAEYAVIADPIEVEGDSAATYFGAVIPAATEDRDLEEFLVAQVSRASIDQQFAFLAASNSEQPPAEPDFTAAMLVVLLENKTALQEGEVEVALDPAPEPDTYYAPNSSGAPVLNSQTMAYVALPAVIYYNLPPGDPEAIEITASHPSRTCTTLPGLHPLLGGHITVVRISCV